MGTLHLERSRRTMRKFVVVVCLTVFAGAEAGAKYDRRSAEADAEANAEADADSFYDNFPNSLRYSGLSFRNVKIYDLNRIREFLNKQQEFNGQFLGGQNSQFQQRQFEGQQNQPGQFSTQPQTLQQFPKAQDYSNKKQQQFISLSQPQQQQPLNPSQNNPWSNQFDLQYSLQFNPQNQQSQHQGNQQYNPLNQQSQFQGYQQNQFQRNQLNQFEGQQYEQRQFPSQPESQFHANQKQQQFASQHQQPFNPALNQNNHFSQKFSNPQGSQFYDQNSQQFNPQFQENLQSQFDGQQQYQQRQFSIQPQLQTYQQKTHDQAHQDQFVSQRRQQFNQDFNRVVIPSNVQDFRNGVNGF